MPLPIPEAVTLVDADTTCSIRVEDEMGELVLTSTAPGGVEVIVWLNTSQARKLRGRLDKFLRENG